MTLPLLPKSHLPLHGGPTFSLCYLRPQDPLQPPAGLPSDPGCSLLADPAASLSLQPLQLLGHPGVLQGGPAHPPGELGGCDCVEGCHVQGQRTGEE